MNRAGCGLKTASVSILVILGFMIGQWISSAIWIPVHYVIFVGLSGMALTWFFLTYMVSSRRMTEEKKEGVLPPEEAREWLDDFLVKQQSNDDAV